MATTNVQPASPKISAHRITPTNLAAPSRCACRQGKKAPTISETATRHGETISTCISARGRETSFVFRLPQHHLPAWTIRPFFHAEASTAWIGAIGLGTSVALARQLMQEPTGTVPRH